jgi:hypothetical protein
MPVTFQVRELDNTLPQESPREDKGAVSDKPRRGRPRKVNPAENFQEIVRRLTPQIERFAGVVIDHLEIMRLSAIGLRGDRRFTERMTRNERRAKAVGFPGFTRTGSVDPKSEDGHLSMGLQQGWSFQAQRSAKTFLFRTMFEQSDQFFTTTIIGDHPMNEKLLKLVDGIVEDMIRAGKFRASMRNIHLKVPRHGTAILRYQYMREVTFERGFFDGKFRETLSEPKPVFTPWPIQNFLVTNYDRPGMEEQEGFFWITPDTNLGKLEREEAVFSLDQRTQSFVQVGGKFRNLESLRRAHWRENIKPNHRDGSTIGHTRLEDRSRSVSAFPSLTLVEYQGRLPMASWVKLGHLTPEIAALFGIDVGEVPNPNNEVEMESWGRRLEKIEVYNISYTVDGTGGTGRASDRHLLQVEPDRHRRPRKEGYVFRWMEDDDEFMGLSITDVGHSWERIGDLLKNLQTYVLWKNGHPSHVYDLTALKRRAFEEIERLLTAPDALIPVRANGADVSKIIQSFKLDVDLGQLDRAIASAKFEFELTTAVSAIQKGVASSETLGQDRLKEAKSDSALVDILLGVLRCPA